MSNRKFRYSNALESAGVNSAKQHLIYGITNYRKRSKEHDEIIKNVCWEVAGSEADALYEFLTNDRINATYINDKYGIDIHRLFKMKTEFYIEFGKRI